MVFQDPQSALNPRRRVGAIVTQPLEAAGGSSREQRAERARATAARDRSAAGNGGAFPAQLSGGQTPARQYCPRAVRRAENPDCRRDRVRASMSRCRRNCSILLIRLRAERAFSMVFISHDLSVVRYLCDRVLVMYRGEIVERARPAKVFAAPQASLHARACLQRCRPTIRRRSWAPDLVERDHAYV